MPTVQLRPDYKVHMIGGGVSHHISWNGWNDNAETQNIFGHMHLAFRPRNGDVLLGNMRSGKIAVYVIHNIEKALGNDPTDMFFGKASFVGFQGEVELPKSTIGVRSDG